MPLPLLWVVTAGGKECPERNYQLTTQMEVDVLAESSGNRIKGNLPVCNSRRHEYGAHCFGTQEEIILATLA